MRRSSHLITIIFALALWSPEAHAQATACPKAASAPVAADDNALWPAGAVVIDVLGNDYDPDGDAIAITSFTSGAHGTVSYTEDFEALLYTPAGGTAMNDQFTYSISDGMFNVSGTVRLTADALPPPPPPPQARVWFTYACSGVTCQFTGYWDIADTPRYFHWDFGDGTSTPPGYNIRYAGHAFSPGIRWVTLIIKFVSGQEISSGPLRVDVPNPNVVCSWDLTTWGLSFQGQVMYVRDAATGQPVQFDAYRYFWDFGDGSPLFPTDHFLLFQNRYGKTYHQPGPRTINFLVKTLDLSTIAGQCPRVADLVNEAPVPDFEAVPGDGITRAKRLFRFTPSAIDEWYLELGPWEWNFGDGSFATTPGPTAVDHYYPRPGNYTVTLKVTDSLGASGTGQKSITAANDPPVILWKFNCSGRTCTFDATDSFDDSGVMTYRWNFGDGSPVEVRETPAITHTFDADQAYDVTLTLDDGSLQTSKALRLTTRAAPFAEALVFYALPPCRVLDTRLEGRPPINGNVVTPIVVGGVCGVPPTAKAAAVSATIISPTNGGHLQLFPAGAPAGDTSVLNFSPARSPRANNAIVSVGANGTINARPAIIASGTTHLVVDVTGYFASELTGLAPARGPMRYDRYFDGVYRLFDSRTTPPSLSAGIPRYVRMRNSAFVGMPLDAEAHAITITAFNPSSGGHFVVYPSDLAAPLAAAMNVQAGQAMSNGSLMALGRRTADDLAVIFGAAGGSTTDFAIDTYGWFAKDAKYRYYAIQPCRAVDTRQLVHGGPRLTSGAGRYVQMQGNCGVPQGTKFAVVTATIINSDGPGSAQIGGASDLTISNIQFGAADTIANTLIVALGQLSPTNCCSGDLGTSMTIPGGGGADLVIDVLGYFLPEANQPPVATADSATAVVNLPLMIDVLANDSDDNGDAIKLSTTRPIFNPPSKGTATRASDTSITYTPASEGPDSFDYEVVDTRGGISHGRVTITVRPTNAAPVANPDAATTSSISSVTIDVIANDSDPDGDALTIHSVTAPAKGTAEILSNLVLYTPNESASGLDTFSYTVRDPFSAQGSSTVTVTITVPNRPPNAVEDSVTVYAGASVAITPLINDTDPDGDALKLSDPAITETPTLGSAVRTNDTTITYTAGQTANPDVFQYSMHDGRGASARGAITVTIQPTCTAPPTISAQPTSRTIYAGQPTTLTVTASGGVRPLTYQWYQGTTPLPGETSSSLTVSPTATTSYSVNVSNACGTTVSSAATVTVCAPLAIGTQPASQSITVGTAATLTVVAGGSGPFSYQWYEGVTGSTTTPVGTNSASFVTPVLTANRSYWVRVTSTCSGTASINSATAEITVTCTAAPVITTPPASPVINGGQPVTLSVTASAAAAYQWYEGTSGTTTTPVGTGSSVTVSPTITTSYWVSISNACGSTASNTATVTVCNPVGITTHPAPQTVTAGSTATLSVAAAPLLADPKIIASSPAITGWSVSNVFDNNANTDYASNGAGTNTFIDFDFGTAARFAEVTFTDRKSAGGTNGSGAGGSGENVTAFDLIFSGDAAFGNGDDVRVAVTSTACCDTVVTPIANIVARYLRYDVTAASGVNAGAAELSFRAFDTIEAPVYSYQWYEGASGTTTTPAGTNSSSFTTSALSANKTYWARVTSTCNGTKTADSNAATITVTCANPPTITAQPTSRTINAGQSTTLTVTASSVGPATYQWFEETTQIPGAITNSLTVSPSATKNYSVRVTNACGSIDSVTATVTVCNPPAIVTQPASQSVVVGSTATLSVVAGGSGPFSYQWYEGTSGTATTPVGTNSASFTTPALSANKSYWVRVSSTCNGTQSVNSNTAIITVTCSAPPTIITQPSSRTISSGQATTLTVTANSVGAPAYQWYQGTAPATTTPVGTNSSSLTVTPAATTSYWVRVTNACGSTNGNTAIVTVCNTLGIATQPASQTITNGSTATLTVTPGGSGPFSYQWYEGASGTTTTPVGTNANSYTTPALSANRSYWVKVTSTCNGTTSVNSTTAVITVTCATAPSISASPTSRTINAGQSTTLTVTASGFGALTYQWYQGTAPSTTTAVGTNSSSLTVTPGATTDYWVKVSNACGGMNSTTATVTVCNPPGVAAHPASTTIAYNASATLAVTASGSGPIAYQWYEGASGVATTPVGTNSASFTTPALQTTKSYWVRVTSTCNGTASANSNAATVTVTPQQITRRQTSYVLANSQTSITGTWTQPTQSGNLLVAVLTGDKHSNGGFMTWTAPAGWVQAATYEWNFVKASIYYIPNNAGGRTSETFTVTPGYHDQILHLLEYSGVMTVNPLDKTALNGNDTNDGYVDTGYTANTVQPKELVITALTTYTATEFWSPSNGFVEIYDHAYSWWDITTAVHERITTFAGSWGHEATVGVPAEWVGLVVTFKAANTN